MNDAVDELARIGGIEQRGAINTRQEVVEFILDLIGYEAGRNLTFTRLLEPSFGNGDFLIPALERLLSSFESNMTPLKPRLLSDSIRAVELHHDTHEQTRIKIIDLLIDRGLRKTSATKLADTWLIQGDFLLTEFEQTFTHIAGNPPYVRQEQIPDVLIKEYRQRYKTIFDRADLYVPFIEKSLRHIDDNGLLGFICADRWMKNRYGKPLREFVSRDYHLKYYVDMHGSDAFHNEVNAYPAITVFGKGAGSETKVFSQPIVNKKALSKLAKQFKTSVQKSAGTPKHIPQAATSGAPWLLDASEELALVRKIEMRFELIESVGCKVGIGVATGADKAFIGPFDKLDVEESRKLPLVTTKDISNGYIKWGGLGVVNPFDDSGKLVSLDEYPKFRAYLEEHRDVISGRHVALKNPKSWYRTIDKISPPLTYQEKLLIPDIKGSAVIAAEFGSYYPHHNLYFISTEEWDIRALQTVLMSGIANLFVSIYTTKMRGGYLRFQAQYLRKIRLPRWTDLTLDIQKKLISLNLNRCDRQIAELVGDMYGMTKSELNLIGRHSNGT